MPTEAWPSESSGGLMRSYLTTISSYLKSIKLIFIDIQQLLISTDIY